jgi:hypothetical protein
VKNPKDGAVYLIGTQDRCGYTCAMNTVTGVLAYFHALDEVEFIKVFEL